jgi:hypothetical protein
MKRTLAAGAAFALLASAVVAVPAPDHHQGEEQDIDQLIELMRKDVRAEKADIVAKTMELDADQAAAFWPVYKKYEVEAKTLGDERLKIITDYAEDFETLTDAKAEDLITRAIAFLAVLPAKVVARFFQVDNRINNLIDLELSSQIPLAY